MIAMSEQNKSILEGTLSHEQLEILNRTEPVKPEEYEERNK